VPWETELVTSELPWEKTDRKDALARAVQG